MRTLCKANAKILYKLGNDLDSIISNIVNGSVLLFCCDELLMSLAKASFPIYRFVCMIHVSVEKECMDMIDERRVSFIHILDFD